MKRYDSQGFISFCCFAAIALLIGLGALSRHCEAHALPPTKQDLCNRASPPVIDSARLVSPAQQTAPTVTPGSSSPARDGAAQANTLPTGWPVLGEATRAERLLIDTAAHHCPYAGPGRLDVARALQLLRLEGDVGLPSYMRGLTLATWCREAAYGVEDVIGDGGDAVGPMQLHGLLASHCGPVYARHSLPWSARCYLHHVLRVLPKVERMCGRSARPDSLTVSEAWVASWARYGGDCRAASSHTRLLSDWRQRMRRVVAHEKQHALACEERGH